MIPTRSYNSKNILIKSDCIEFNCKDYIIMNKDMLLKQLFSEKQLHFFENINNLEPTKKNSTIIYDGENWVSKFN